MNADTAISFTARKTAVPSDRPANQDKPYGR
jgi:hypothetical protein